MDSYFSLWVKEARYLHAFLSVRCWFVILRSDLGISSQSGNFNYRHSSLVAKRNYFFRNWLYWGIIYIQWNAPSFKCTFRWDLRNAYIYGNSITTIKIWNIYMIPKSSFVFLFSPFPPLKALASPYLLYAIID